MRLASLITAFLLFFVSFSASASAETANGFNERDGEGMPIVSCDTVLKQREWDGKARLRSDSCYFVDSPVVVTADNKLPANSMIVVENGGKLTVSEDVKLYVGGVVIVHSKASLVIDGRVILKSASAAVINGRLLIGGEGRLSVYGSVQISEGGVMGVKGRAAVHKNGAVLNYGTIKKMSSSAVVPGETKDAHGEIPLYVAEEYSDYLDNDIIIGSIMDNEVTLKDRAEKQKIIRSFESVLYRYDGEFKDVSVFILKYYYYMKIRLDDDRQNDIWAGIYSRNCLAPHEWDEDGFETAKGRFYSSVLGKVDTSLFDAVDPDRYIAIEFGKDIDGVETGR